MGGYGGVEPPAGRRAGYYQPGLTAFAKATASLAEALRAEAEDPAATLLL